MTLELPPLPQAILSSSGLKPLSFVLDNKVGPEVILLITESRPHVTEFEGRNISGFWMKSGLVNTLCGPVYWLLFYFPSPLTGERIIYENVVNPKEPDHLSIYAQLANQEYWHVVIADDSGEVVNFFEFKNKYGLAEAIRQVEEVCAGMNVSDFVRAKREYHNTYSIEKLMDA